MKYRYNYSLLIFIFFFSSEKAIAQAQVPSKQEVLEKFGFEEQRIITSTDTLAFYLRKKGTAPENLVIYLQGSTPDPLFKIEEHEGQYKIFRWFPGDYKLLDNTYCYVVISKSGIPEQ